MKRIEMILSDGTTRTSLSEIFDSTASWPALAYQFYCFLQAQGYQIDMEDVGADVADYVACRFNEDEEY
jgi:hypothetical protein